MQKLLIITSLFVSNLVSAQNVGIGTASPAGKLTISGSETTFNGLNSGLQITNTAAGGGSWYLRAGATGTSTPAGGFSIGNNAEYLLAFDNIGRLGLGTLAPTERIHLVSGNMRLADSDKGIILNGLDRAMITRGFDPFTSGFHAGLGRWGLFMEPNALTLGIPNSFGKAVEISKFNADGTKIPVFGINTDGVIKLFGNGGTSGQVLTSNATGAAAWTNAALTGNTRFSVNFTIPGFGTSLANVTFAASARYNLDPANIVISGTGITFNKAGLYHFELYTEAETGYPAGSPPADIPSFFAELNAGQTTNYPLLNERMAGRSNNPGAFNTAFDFDKLVKFEVYIEAGSVIRVRTGINAPLATGYFTSGHLTAHLISE
jgi:hypothetical protein